MKIYSPFVALVAFFTLFSLVLAGADSTSLQFSTITTNGVVKTLVLKTTVITSCPCSTTATIMPTGSGSGKNPTAQAQGSSAGSTIRPSLLGVAGGIGVLSSLLFMFI